MSMIEKVARALAKADGIEICSDASYRHSAYGIRARAAIKAMREPSPAMLDRFVSRALCVSIHGEGGWSEYGRNQWQAMIDAALAE